MTHLFPKLIVVGADNAIAFYVKALGMTLHARHLDDNGTVVHAELAFGSQRIAVAEAVEGWGWMAPTTSSTSPVLLTVVSSDPDAVAQLMVDDGATMLIPLEDRPYGKREGRIQDPFGHLWIVASGLRGS